MNSRLDDLHSYPFARLRALLADVAGNSEYSPISLAIGEPQAAPPDLVLEVLRNHLGSLNGYPLALGKPELRQAIANWLIQRYRLPHKLIDPDSMVLPLQGTREGLFAIAQTLVDAGKDIDEKPLVMMPSPFYQIYEGAAILAGAEPSYLPCVAENNFQLELERVSEQQWRRCQMIYLCNPGNPTGAVMSLADYQRLLELADRYDFVIVSDECYSEIYIDEQSPCTGLLQACHLSGRNRLERCLVFNSLSKRSNLAGMRSGFVVGDPALIQAFLLYRTYHGSAMPEHHQFASIAAWQDEQHVIENRAGYREKLVAAVEILKSVMPVQLPAGGFCLWAKLPMDDQQFAKALYENQHVTVLPGSYLAREIDGVNPGKNYVRMAMVPSKLHCVEAATRIRDFLTH